jgi:hypothetical protein
MKRCFSICWLILFALTVTARAENAVSRFGPQAMWILPLADWSDCLEKHQDPGGCLDQLMHKAGASPQALAVSRLLDDEAYMSAFREMGRVDLASITFPARANTNEVPYLVNGNPSLVSTELDASTVDITKDPHYPALKAAFPDMELWPSGAEFRSMDHLVDGGQGFVFAYPLQNGCHACERAGYAVVTHDFGPDGTYRGPRLLRLEPKR